MNQYEFFNRSVITPSGELLVTDVNNDNLNSLLIDLRDSIEAGNTQVSNLLLNILTSSLMTNQGLFNMNNTLLEILNKPDNSQGIIDAINNKSYEINVDCPDLVLPPANPEKIVPIIIYEPSRRFKDCVPVNKCIPNTKRLDYPFYKPEKPRVQEVTIEELFTPKHCVEVGDGKRTSKWKQIHKNDIKNRQTCW